MCKLAGKIQNMAIYGVILHFRDVELGLSFFIFEKGCRTWTIFFYF